MQDALDLIARWEGLHQVRADGLVYPYLCPAGYWTQGYGRLVAGPHVPPISRDTAWRWLEQDTWKHRRIALRVCPALELLPESCIDACTSFVFNLGGGAFKASTLRKRIEAAEYDDVPRQFSRWVFGGGRKLPGLVLRREAEAALFMRDL